MIQDVLDASHQIFHPRFRSIFVQTLVTTIFVLVVFGILADKILVGFVEPSHPWVATALGWLAGLGLVIGLAFLITPVSLLVGGFFFDSLAAVVEDDIRPIDGPGRALSVTTASWVALKFGFVALCVNAVALCLLLVPGLNAIAFFGANAYLLGRGYFELAALRYVSLDEVKRLRQRHALSIYASGLCMAAFMSVPILNLLTPLFAAALSVRLRARLFAAGASVK
jgi:CysZ protein